MTGRVPVVRAVQELKLGKWDSGDCPRCPTLFGGKEIIQGEDGLENAAVGVISDAAGCDQGWMNGKTGSGAGDKIMDFPVQIKCCFFSNDVFRS